MLDKSTAAGYSYPAELLENWYLPKLVTYTRYLGRLSYHFFTWINKKFREGMENALGAKNDFLEKLISVLNLCATLKLAIHLLTSYLTVPYVLPYCTLRLTLLYLTSYLTLLSYLTLPYVLSYHTSYLTLCLTLPYVLPYLTLPYCT